MRHIRISLDAEHGVVVSPDGALSLNSISSRRFQLADVPALRRRVIRATMFRSHENRHVLTYKHGADIPGFYSYFVFDSMVAGQRFAQWNISRPKKRIAEAAFQNPVSKGSGEKFPQCTNPYATLYSFTSHSTASSIWDAVF